ncbi:MAG: hypothetical protein MZW92_16115 [Comamonadaceae bacterium]|nr:hypothetical protein [Comamonadaceae bacterium]
MPPSRFSPPHLMTACRPGPEAQGHDHEPMHRRSSTTTPARTPAAPAAPRTPGPRCRRRWRRPSATAARRAPPRC